MIPENQKFIADLTGAFNRNMGNKLTPEIGVSLLNIIGEHLLSLEQLAVKDTPKEVTE